MFQTESTWMTINKNFVCNTPDIAEPNLQNKNSDGVVCMRGKVDIANASFWNPNCLSEQPPHFSKTGMMNMLNNELLNGNATSDLRVVEHPSVCQPLMSSSSSNSNNWPRFDACRSTIETRKADCVIGNGPWNADKQDFTLIQDFKTLTELEVPRTNLGSKSINNSCLFYEKKRKRKTAVKEKDDKYWNRRQKNNLAAKRSRDMKRAKELSVERRLTSLEIENRRLQLELSCLLEQNKNLKQIIGRF